jgi:hypothetical protein
MMKDAFTGEEITTPNSKSAIPLEVNFEPATPADFQGNINSISPTEYKENEKPKPFQPGYIKEPHHAGFFETATAQFKEVSEIANYLDFSDRHILDVNPMDDIVPTGWNPKDDPSAFEGIQSKWNSYLMGATGPKDLRRRYNYALDKQSQEELIKNGSFMGWLAGGFAGLSPFGSPSTLIPIAGQIKYAKYGKTILNSMGRALPGLSLGSAMHEATLETTKATGNLENFVVDTFADIVFGEVFIGAGAGISRLIDTGAAWNLRKLITPYYHGIDYKVKVNEKGEFKGYTAVDSTGSLSAAEVNYAQDLADSTLSKSGLFKIPGFGDAAYKFFGVFSPKVRMFTSKFPTIRGMINRVADHSFITEGIEKGQSAPQTFTNLMNKLEGSNRSLSAQLNALHLVRNGMEIGNRATNSLKNLAGKFTKDGYIDRAEFGDEVRQVLINETASANAATNEAAALLRKHIDESYDQFRQAYNLPKDWLPPRTAEGYLMRVYDTNFMTLHENEWHNVITGWLKQSDEQINNYMQPIKNAEIQIAEYESKHNELINRPNITDQQVKKSAEELIARKANKKALEEKLQNELRTNPDLHIHVEDMNALSANEAKEIQQLTKHQNIALKELEEKKAIVSKIKSQAKQRAGAAKKSKTVKGAKDNLRKSATGELVLEQEESKLAIAQREYDEETEKLQQMMHNGEINSRLFYKEPDSFIYRFKDTNDRLKFRQTHESDFHRQQASKAYYDTIMNQTPEQILSQIMGKLSGGARTNPLKQRTLLIPDNVLYENNFLVKDIMPNVINYRNFLGRRTFMKNVFNDITLDGGIEPLVNSLSKEYEGFRRKLNTNLISNAERHEELKNNEKISDKEKKKNESKLEEEKLAIQKEINKLAKQYNTAKEQMSIVYDKMMGNRQGSKQAEKYSQMLMNFTVSTKLGFVPFAMMTDLMANALQHGVWPFIRDGIVPAVTSLGGLLKTKDSEGLRKAAPHVHLALQDMLMGYADKNFAGQAQPFINMGSRVATGLENIAHISSNLTGTNYLDNALQHISGGIMQSTIIEKMFEYQAGTLSKRDLNNILKYGLNPKEWSERFINAWKKSGSDKTKLGGYNSKFWAWDDLEAANKFSDTVFRGVKDTVIQRDILDAPFFMDNPLGRIIMAFKGWTFASLNRYVIPAMQQADGQKLMGMSLMLAAGALVSPARRIASGKDPYPEDSTPEQIAWAAFQDSGIFSFFGNVIEDMNLLSGGVLLGNLKNDRYRDRTMSGLLGPVAGQANDVYSILGMMWSGEVNQSDVNKMVRLIPFANMTETRGLSNKIIESLELPRTRAEARALE